LPASKRDFVAGELLTLKQNGGWCWFQGPRAMVDGDRVLVGTVAGDSYAGSQRGDIEVTTFDIDTRTSETFKLHEMLQSDDHASPSLAILPDGRYLAMYTTHGSDSLMRWRTSTQPHDTSAWAPERTIYVGARVTYSNTFPLSREPDRVYSFYRGARNKPHVMIGPASAADFQPAGQLLEWELSPEFGADPSKITGRSEIAKPYVVYHSGGVDTIQFITTEDHPRGYDNGIHHGFIRGGKVHDSFGRVVDENLLDQQGAKLVDLTPVFEGDPEHVAWTTDIKTDERGYPYVAFSVQRDGAPTRRIQQNKDGLDHRYYYGRFDGERWHVNEMAHAGTKLYVHEQNYTGLVALDPNDPDTVYVSTNSDPVSGDPLVSRADGQRHWEIFRGQTRDFGATWSWTPITSNSSTDNLRPVIPLWKEHTFILWLRGPYHSMSSFHQDVVGLLDPGASQETPRGRCPSSEPYPSRDVRRHAREDDQADRAQTLTWIADCTESASRARHPR
jgi:hypothetical protein